MTELQNKMNKMAKLAMAEVRKKHGEDAGLKEGDEFVTVFNDCVFMLGIENGNITMSVKMGKPFFVNKTIDLFNESEPINE